MEDVLISCEIVYCFYICQLDGRYSTRMSASKKFRILIYGLIIRRPIGTPSCSRSKDKKNLFYALKSYVFRMSLCCRIFYRNFQSIFRCRYSPSFSMSSKFGYSQGDDDCQTKFVTQISGGTIHSCISWNWYRVLGACVDLELYHC